jgi:hypothetical protein
MAEPKKVLDIMIDTQNIPTFYVNHAHVNISLTDFRVYLGEVAPKNYRVGVLADPEMSVNPRVSIVMNPEFAKTLCDVIKSTVDQYEAKFGKLRESKAILLVPTQKQ